MEYISKVTCNRNWFKLKTRKESVMKIYKKMFKNKFTKKEERTEVFMQTPNHMYFVGRWKEGKCWIKAEIEKTNGEVNIVMDKNKQKKRAVITDATYSLYFVEIAKGSKVYRRRFWYC